MCLLCLQIIQTVPEDNLAGQYILKAVSDKNGAGIGLTLGICVAFIGLIFDNLIRTWVDKRKKHLGID